jgi:hypothetical protein
MHIGFDEEAEEMDKSEGEPSTASLTLQVVAVGESGSSEVVHVPPSAD